MRPPALPERRPLPGDGGGRAPVPLPARFLGNPLRDVAGLPVQTLPKRRHLPGGPPGPRPLRLPLPRPLLGRALRDAGGSAPAGRGRGRGLPPRGVRPAGAGRHVRPAVRPARVRLGRRRLLPAPARPLGPMRRPRRLPPALPERPLRPTVRQPRLPLRRLRVPVRQQALQVRAARRDGGTVVRWLFTLWGFRNVLSHGLESVSKSSVVFNPKLLHQHSNVQLSTF